MIPHKIQIENIGDAPETFIILGSHRSANFDLPPTVSIEYLNQKGAFTYCMFLIMAIQNRLKVKQAICGDREFIYNDNGTVVPDGWKLQPKEKIVIELKMEPKPENNVPPPIPRQNQ